MNRKLTDKEAAFLLELRDLMAKHNAIVFAEDGRVCFDVEYSDWMTRWNRSCCRRDSRYITKLMNS